MQEIEQFLDDAKQLPPAPQTLLQLIEVLKEPDADSGRIVELLSYDASLTAELLRICNSAYFGGETEIADVDQAVLRLGFENIYRIAASACGVRLFTAVRAGWGANTGQLWRHSVASALAAQMLAREGGLDTGLAFTAGLLHDLGKTVFACALEHIYGKLVEDAEQNQACLAATEKRLLGLDHAQVGASLLARWGSPEMLVECVRFHHQPGESGEAGPIAACVYMGDMLAYFLDYACGSTAFSFAGRQQAQRLLGLSTSQFPYLLSQTIESMGMVEVLSR